MIRDSITIYGCSEENPQSAFIRLSVTVLSMVLRNWLWYFCPRSAEPNHRLTIE